MNNVLDKRFLTVEEFCQYTSFKKSYVYKLTHLGKIPGVFKPLGNKIFFDRLIVEQWLGSNPIMTADEKDRAASTYITTGKLN